MISCVSNESYDICHKIQNKSCQAATPVDPPVAADSDSEAGAYCGIHWLPLLRLLFAPCATIRQYVSCPDTAASIAKPSLALSRGHLANVAGGICRCVRDIADRGCARAPTSEHVCPAHHSMQHVACVLRIGGVRRRVRNYAAGVPHPFFEQFHFVIILPEVRQRRCRVRPHGGGRPAAMGDAAALTFACGAWIVCFRWDSNRPNATPSD